MDHSFHCPAFALAAAKHGAGSGYWILSGLGRLKDFGPPVGRLRLTPALRPATTPGHQIRTSHRLADVHPCLHVQYSHEPLPPDLWRVQ